MAPAVHEREERGGDRHARVRSEEAHEDGLEEAAKEELGISAIGRGFQVTMAVPFNENLAMGLKSTAQKCAEVCPTAALAIKTDRACDKCNINIQG